ncbi:MAG TPA: hypothetical protein QF509_03525 [Rhodospirillales bacterium]|nr:hypothetical protein [Rhodospirillales bacterium]
MTIDLDHLRQWIGGSDETSETLAAAPLAGLAAILNHDGARPDPGSEVPPGGIGCILPAPPGSRNWPPTVMPSAADFCRRCRCPRACGRVEVSNVIGPCGLAGRRGGSRESTT